MNSRKSIVCLIALYGLWSCVTAPAAEDSAKADRATARIEKLITDLDSDEFTIRQRATQNLIHEGSKAIEPLANAARTGSLEVTTRAVTILEQIYVLSHKAGNTQTVDRVEEILGELARSKNQSIAGRADSVLVKHYDIRESRAITEIRRAGGIFKRANGDSEFIPGGGKKVPYHDLLLHIGEKWQAGDQGLRHIKRLSRLRLIRFVVDVNGVSAKGLEELASALPDVQIHARGAAKLGIAGLPHPSGCEVTAVATGSAAEQAKLQLHDIIVRYNDTKIADFEALVELIKTQKPGDKATLTIMRRGLATPLKLNVTLKGWEN